MAANGTGLQSTDDPAKRPDVFGLNGAVHLEDIPAGRFRNELSRLNEPARRYALEKLGRLQVPLNDVASLSVEGNGQLFYQCNPPHRPPPPIVVLDRQSEIKAELPNAPPNKTESAIAVPIATPPARHSRPGATKVIYLDFNGYTISGTLWNLQKGNVGDADYRPAVAAYVAKPFNTDGDPTTFSDAEQAVIVQVWERVAEDYRGFDVDVTTEEPASFTSNTGRILITDNVDANGVNMPSSTAAGVAYLDVFGDPNYANYYSPALVYANQNYNYASYIAEGASHEMGHNLSLSHDGTTTGDEYYSGHGSGDTSWNSIMGAAYTENVTQWSKGEYYNANNHEDDLAIIAGHLGYVPDDYSDTNATATPLTVSGLTVVGSGVISQTDEADRFSFESGAGAITINAATFRSASQTHGGNLDAALELYDAGGNLVASANVDGVTNATLSTTVTGGTYYLRVFGAGSGSPLSSSPTGYTSYGSLGQYTISGTVIAMPIAPTITGQPGNQTVLAGQPAQFTVSASGLPAPSFQWQRLPAGSAVWSNLSEAGAYSGTTARTLNIAITTTAMNSDQFRCVATNSAGSATSSPTTLTVNPVSAPVISGLQATVTIDYGDNLGLSPTITGTQPISFQWKKDGVALPGATASEYAKFGVTLADSGIYTLTATNGAGSITSSNCTVTVHPAVAPTIVQQPDSINVAQTFTANFNISAGGSKPLSYQWQIRQSNNSAWYALGPDGALGVPGGLEVFTPSVFHTYYGTTSASLLIYATQSMDRNQFRCVASNSMGSVTSNTATLSVQLNPVAPTAAVISITSE